MEKSRLLKGIIRNKLNLYRTIMIKSFVRRIPLCSLLFFVLISGGFKRGYSQGNLMIVGGGLEHTNKEIYTEMIRLAGGPERAVFSVIPAASGVAMQTFVSFSNALKSYGVPSENIHLINIAMVDDDSTKNENEAEWARNATDPKLAEKVRNSTCVWFSGGDQVRIMKTLIQANGTKTPVLEAVWEVFTKGGLIGGTSAGAAIMSNPMIAGGSSMEALIHGVTHYQPGHDVPEPEGFLMTQGLGFFPTGIVDQHFHARSRIGRLIIAMFQSGKSKIGFGVDENTALIYLGKQNKIKVSGAAAVTIINISEAQLSYINNRPSIKNLIISCLEEGDTYDISTGQIIPASGKRLTNGHESYDRANPIPAGILSGNSPGFYDLITQNLIDNKKLTSVQNLTFIDGSSAFLTTLTKTSASQGYFYRKANRQPGYTVVGIKMDITPVEVTLNTLQ